MRRIVEISYCSKRWSDDRLEMMSILRSLIGGNLRFTRFTFIFFAADRLTKFNSLSIDVDISATAAEHFMSPTVANEHKRRLFRRRREKRNLHRLMDHTLFWPAQTCAKNRNPQATKKFKPVFFLQNRMKKQRISLAWTFKNKIVFWVGFLLVWRTCPLQFSRGGKRKLWKKEENY